MMLQVRGIGTDIAIVSCMVFLAQFILSSLMGSIVASSGIISSYYGGVQISRKHNFLWGREACLYIIFLFFKAGSSSMAFIR